MVKAFGQALNDAIFKKTAADLELIRMRHGVTQGTRNYAATELLAAAQACEHCAREVVIEVLAQMEQQPEQQPK